MMLRAAELTEHHLVEYDDVPCRVLWKTDLGAKAVLVRVLPESAFADPILLHYWRDEEVCVCGWAAT